MKIEIAIVAAAMKDAGVEPAVLRQVIETLNLEAQPEPGDEDAAPKIKKQYSVIIYDRDGTLPKLDYVASIVQIPENESVATVLERVYRAAYDFNASKKGRLLPVKTVGEALENVPAKYLKEAELWVKTKTPVLVIKSDNNIPKATNE